jgi:hypothetical protein
VRRRRDDVPAGRYVVRLMKDDGELARSSFTVVRR